MMSRARDVSNDQANVGGSVAPYVSGKNFAINGGFDIWQRGTSTSVGSGANAYTADRWSFLNPGTATWTISRQTTSDTTNLPNIQYCARIQRNSGQTNTSIVYYTSSMETVNSIPYVGKTVTFSFYARAGANFSATSSAIGVVLASGTGTDQNINNAFTGGIFVVNQVVNLTTTWQRFSFTGSVSSSANQLGYYFNTTPVGTAGANDYFEVTGVQLEQGSIATPFSRAGGSIGGELALCQRYYWRVSPTASNAPVATNGMATSTTVFRASVPTKQTMRTNPSSVDFANLQIADGVSGYAITAIAFGSSTDALDLQITSSGMTQFRGGWIVTSSTSGYLGWNAEL